VIAPTGLLAKTFCRFREAQFYRQKIIGDYIVDFYCPRAKLIIEVDGAQHYEADGAEKDRIRDDQMRALGQNVLRFSNREVLGNIAGVIEAVYDNLCSDESH